ncbi:MAG: universal stress protein [Candidatus Bathyarchaeota archaeon]|nr:universal stress protein [Candidatus Bathyarchaeota archaeon A05DMB-5]MDH7557973.1 universal stress protein [Candidatus Bathyarchaeota archaeon]
MKKILVGVDGSEYAEKALKQAIQIAQKFSAQVTVVNVYHAPTGQEVSQKILDKAKAILENNDVKFNLVSVLNPNTPKVITDMAEDEKFDLIVVGSRGIGAIHAYLIGSVCNKICYDSPVSVLVVK